MIKTNQPPRFPGRFNPGLARQLDTYEGGRLK